MLKFDRNIEKYLFEAQRQKEYRMKGIFESSIWSHDNVPNLLLSVWYRKKLLFEVFPPYKKNSGWPRYVKRKQKQFGHEATISLNFNRRNGNGTTRFVRAWRQARRIYESINEEIRWNRKFVRSCRVLYLPINTATVVRLYVCVCVCLHCAVAQAWRPGPSGTSKIC